MSTSKLLSALVLSALVLVAAACGGRHSPTAEYLPSHTRENQSFSNPNLGQEVKPEEIAAWDISIPPDGSGLPAGSGTAAEGEAVYNAKCAGCHGVKGIKGPADPLVGGIGTLASKKPVKTVGSYWPYATTLFDYIRRAMPFNAPQSLSNNEVYALSAYILSLNNIIDPEARMDAKTLPQVKMPNRDGFVSYWP
jgi:S-disulfanyl-L-cysteine oxidoreductase SoxD